MRNIIITMSSWPLLRTTSLSQHAFKIDQTAASPKAASVGTQGVSSVYAPIWEIMTRPGQQSSYNADVAESVWSTYKVGQAQADHMSLPPENVQQVMKRFPGLAEPRRATQPVADTVQLEMLQRAMHELGPTRSSKLEAEEQCQRDMNNVCN